jgi:hypothetical protein
VGALHEMAKLPNEAGERPRIEIVPDARFSAKDPVFDVSGLQ